MCDFFSLRSDGAGKPYYFDYEVRKRIISGELNYETDSHSSIADYFGFKGKDEDMLNAYEYNPLTKEFKIDRMPNKNDSEQIKCFCKNLDFKTIVPELQIKEIINPRNIIHTDKINDSEIALLMQWASVWDSVVDSVWASVWDSVRDSVRASVGALVWASVKASVKDSVRDSVWDSVKASVKDSVWDSVWDSVKDSVKDSVRDSVRDSVWASVWDSVRDSVWASVWAYISSFYIIANWKYIGHEADKNPFQPCIDLWNLGLVPSFDGKIWILHQMCDNAKVIYEWEPK